MSSRRYGSEASYYLPRFARKAKMAHVRQIGYSVEKDPNTSVITFQYTVAWTDFDNSLMRRYENLKELLSKKVTSIPQNDQIVTLPRLIQCDGACHSWAPEDYIVQFGLCDHNICFRCYENEESISLMGDGSHGCCNKECVKRARAELAMKTSSTDSSTRTNPCGIASYNTFPGRKHKCDGAKSLRPDETRKSELDVWKKKIDEVASDVSYYGRYEDSHLQEMADTMLSSALVGPVHRD